MTKATPQNLYQITGNVADMNTVLIERSELRTLQARIAYLESQLYAIGAGGVGQSIQPLVQPDTVAQQEPVAWKWRYKDGELSSVAFDTREQCESNSMALMVRQSPSTPRPSSLCSKSRWRGLSTSGVELACGIFTLKSVSRWCATKWLTQCGHPSAPPYPSANR